MLELNTVEFLLDKHALIFFCMKKSFEYFIKTVYRIFELNRQKMIKLFILSLRAFTVREKFSLELDNDSNSKRLEFKLINQISKN